MSRLRCEVVVMKEKEKQGSMQDEEIRQMAVDALLEKAKKEVEKERRLVARLQEVVRARDQAVAEAVVQFGDRANVAEIMAFYDGVAAGLDPRCTKLDGLLSLSLENMARPADSVHLLLPGGSVRELDVDVAVCLLNLSNQADGPLRETLEDLQKNLDTDVALQKQFSAEPPSPKVQDPKQEREQRLQRLGLPTVAEEYPEAVRPAERPNGRPLPYVAESAGLSEDRQRA